MAEGGRAFIKLVQEAIGAYRDDFPAIERYVGDRVKAMSEEDRLAIAREIARVLGFREPDASPFEHN